MTDKNPAFSGQMPSDGRRYSFNEFQRQLTNRGVRDPATRYFFVYLYEQMGVLTKQNEEMAAILTTYAENLMAVAQMNANDRNILRSIQKRVNGDDAVEVASVGNEPEKGN